MPRHATSLTWGGASTPQGGSTHESQQPWTNSAATKAERARLRLLINRAPYVVVAVRRHYSEESRNCQTFAADFMRLLTGKDVVPFHPINRVLYRPHPEYFMYDQHCW